MDLSGFADNTYDITLLLGQVFDAYELASRIVRSAKQSIVLIDNYIDEHTLTHLSKKQQGVKALLLTRNISKQLGLDVQKADAQYGDFDVKVTHNSLLNTSQSDKDKVSNRKEG